jgi:ParB-like chromosome segregation protein Spo0J
MKTTTVSLGDLTPLDRNPRKHSNLQIAELKRSVEMFGQIRPLVVDENKTVLAGNGLLIALTQLGWTKAEAYVVSGLSEADKKRLILADNKVAAL